MQQHGSKYFACRPPPPPPPTHTPTPEHGHVAYQIKGNQECSNMVANILPADPPPLPPHTHTHTQNMVMLHIKLKVIGNAAKC